MINAVTTGKREGRRDLSLSGIMMTTTPARRDRTC